jgi:hypothetical protein
MRDAALRAMRAASAMSHGVKSAACGDGAQMMRTRCA